MISTISRRELYCCLQWTYLGSVASSGRHTPLIKLEKLDFPEVSDETFRTTSEARRPPAGATYELDLWPCNPQLRGAVNTSTVETRQGNTENAAFGNQSRNIHRS